MFIIFYLASENQILVATSSESGNAELVPNASSGIQEKLFF